MMYGNINGYNLVAIKQLLHQTLAHVAQHTLHRATTIYAIVVGDVLCKLFDRPHLVHLILGISLRSSIITKVIRHHEHTIVNHFSAPIAGMGLCVYAFSHDAQQK